MSKTKRIIVAVIVIICGVSAVYMAYNRYIGHQSALSEILGKWTVEQAGYQIFSDRVEIVNIKSKSGDFRDYFTVIYDTSGRGLFCAKINENRGQYICQPVFLDKKKISPTDSADSLGAVSVSEIPPFLTEFHGNGNSLKIMGAPLTDEDCVLRQKCNFLLLDKLKR